MRRRKTGDETRERGGKGERVEGEWKTGYGSGKDLYLFGLSLLFQKISVNHFQK